MIPYGRHCIGEDDIEAVVSVLRSDFLTTGPKVREFETALAEKCGATHAVVVNSGTAALHCAYFAAGLGSGDEFITSPVTFAATANAGLYLGATPVFCDVEPETGNLNPDLLEDLITAKTKLIVAVHYAGNPCRMDEIKRVADRHGITVIEDACHALGAAYQGHPVGSCSHSTMAAFSFHPVKSITTGEGGAVLTNDIESAERMRQFREHGITKNPEKFFRKPDGPWHSEMQYLGMNYRLPDINCALGISQLKKLNRFINRRLEIATIYLTELTGNSLFDLPSITHDCQSAWHLFTLRLKASNTVFKTAMISALKENGIGTQVHYLPVSRHPHYANNYPVNNQTPIANQFFDSVFTLPIFPGMDDSDIQLVIEKVNEFKTLQGNF